MIFFKKNKFHWVAWSASIIFIFFVLNLPLRVKAFCCQYEKTCATFKDGSELYCTGGSPAGTPISNQTCLQSTGKCESEGTNFLGKGGYGLEQTASQTSIPQGGSIAGITGKVIGAVLSLVGILFFVLMLYGGVLWMTARGDEAQTKKARDIIFNAVVGLIIISAAGILTSFVFKSVI